MSLNTQLHVGKWTVEPTLNRLTNGQQETMLTPKVMKVLMLLIEAEGQPVSQQTLLDEVWPGQVVSDSSIYQAIAQLRKALGDNSQTPQFIDRVSGQGYRLIVDVTQSSKYIKVSTGSIRFKKTLVVTTLSIILLLLTTYLFIEGGKEPDPGLTKTVRSITVVKFDYPTNLQSAPVSALSDILITQLNRYKKLEVVYLPDSTQPTNTDVILRGKITASESDLQLFLNISSVASKRVLWSQIFKSKPDSLFELQQNILQSVTTFLELHQVTPGISDTKPPPRSFEQYLLARHLWQQRTPSSLRQAENIYQQMAANNQLFPLAAVGYCENYYFLHIYSDFPEQSLLDKCQPLLDKALSKSPHMGEAMAAQAILYNLQGKIELAEPLFRKAVANSPGHATGLMWFGQFLRDSGRFDEALQMSKQAFKLQPMSPMINRSLAYSHLTLSRLDEARYYFERALTLDPQYFLEPVQSLDFLSLNVSRAKEFLRWQRNYPQYLQKMPYARMTGVQIALSLGKLNEAKSLLEQIDKNKINPAFLLYMRAALAIAEADYSRAEQLLAQRMAMHPDKQRFVMPYVSLLCFMGKLEQAQQIFLTFMPGAQSDVKITADNQYLLLLYSRLVGEQGESQEQLQQSLQQWFEMHPPETGFMSALYYSNESPEQARTELSTLMHNGWLPDLNEDLLAEQHMLRLFKATGIGEAQFQQHLNQNRQLAILHSY